MIPIGGRWSLRRRLMLVAALSLAAALASVGTASAHDVLVSTSPAKGATVAKVPASVVLRFDQTALAVGTALIVTGPHGPVQDGAAHVVDNTVTQALRPGAPAGRYDVKWRVTSVDGHPVSGDFTFTARSGSSPRAAASPVAPVPAHARNSSVGWWAAVLLAVLAAAVAAIWRRRQAGSPHPHP